MKFSQSLLSLGFLAATALAVPAPGGPPGHDDHYHPKPPNLPLVDSVCIPTSTRLPNPLTNDNRNLYEML